VLKVGRRLVTKLNASKYALRRPAPTAPSRIRSIAVARLGETVDARLRRWPTTTTLALGAAERFFFRASPIP
jgi:hypothetical protein